MWVRAAPTFSVSCLKCSWDRYLTMSHMSVSRMSHMSLCITCLLHWYLKNLSTEPHASFTDWQIFKSASNVWHCYQNISFHWTRYLTYSPTDGSVCHRYGTDIYVKSDIYVCDTDLQFLFGKNGYCLQWCIDAYAWCICLA